MADNGNLISDGLLKKLRKATDTINRQPHYNVNHFSAQHSNTNTNQSVVARIVGPPSGDWITSGWSDANAFYAARGCYLSGSSFVDNDNYYGYDNSLLLSGDGQFAPLCNIFESGRDILSGVPLSTYVDVFKFADSNGNCLNFFTNENIILVPDITTSMTTVGKTAAQILSAPLTFKYNDNYDALSACQFTCMQSLSYSPDLDSFISFSRNITVDNFGKVISITAAASAVIVETELCTV